LYPPFKIYIFRLLIVKALKLSSLLVQYLHTHKRLDLPGIGSFLLNEPVHPEPEHHKHDKQSELESISFESNTAIKQNPDLVQFIAEQSGKIRALASADLDSHLGLAQQFLNIGNPFLFEGIGILEKIKSGEYVLKSGTGLHEKTKDHSFREKTDSPATGGSGSDYKKIFYPAPATKKWRKPLVITLIAAGIVLAVWGGFMVYQKTTAKNKTVPEVKIKKEVAVPEKDTAMFQKDSAVVPPAQTIGGMQKFILEVCNATRAYERYSRLKTFLWDVQMETKDSMTYKLFMLLPAATGDTSRLIDSLSRLNGRRVYIEQ
jgi:hypothetical protein